MPCRSSSSISRLTSLAHRTLASGKRPPWSSRGALDTVGSWCRTPRSQTERSGGLVQRRAASWRRVFRDRCRVGRNDRPPALGFAMPVPARSWGHQHLLCTALVSRCAHRRIQCCLQVLGRRSVAIAWLPFVGRCIFDHRRTPSILNPQSIRRVHRAKPGVVRVGQAGGRRQSDACALKGVAQLPFRHDCFSVCRPTRAACVVKPQFGVPGGINDRTYLLAGAVALPRRSGQQLCFTVLAGGEGAIEAPVL